MTQQPSYFCIANLGDADPFEYGGAFVCIDRRGIYDPIMLMYDPDFRERREVTLKRCHRITNSDGETIGVGTNRFHVLHEEWFSDSLEGVASFVGQELDDLVNELVSNDVVLRAGTYLSLVGYYGVSEFDHDPYVYEEKEAKIFCDKMLEQIAESKTWWDGYFQKLNK